MNIQNENNTIFISRKIAYYAILDLIYKENLHNIVLGISRQNAYYYPDDLIYKSKIASHLGFKKNY